MSKRNTAPVTDEEIDIAEEELNAADRETVADDFDFTDLDFDVDVETQISEDNAFIAEYVNG